MFPIINNAIATERMAAIGEYFQGAIIETNGTGIDTVAFVCGMSNVSSRRCSRVPTVSSSSGLWRLLKGSNVGNGRGVDLICCTRCRCSRVTSNKNSSDADGNG